MRPVWIDVQLPPSVAAWLGREFGIEGHHVESLGMREADDATIVREAKRAGAVILSKDRDYTFLAPRSGGPPLIWLTCGNVSNNELRQILRGTIEESMALIEGGAMIVEITGRPTRG